MEKQQKTSKSISVGKVSRGTTLKSRIVFFGDEHKPSDVLQKFKDEDFCLESFTSPQKRSHAATCAPIRYDCSTTVSSSKVTYPERDGHLGILSEWTKKDFNVFGKFWRPWMTVSDNRHFFKGRQLYHETVSISSLSFGTLLSSSCFVTHFKEKSVISTGGFTNMLGYFYHDNRYFEVIMEKKRKIKVQYNNIQRIIIEQSGMLYNIFFQLINPPFAFILEEIPSEELKEKNFRRTENPELKEQRVVTYNGMSLDIFGKSNTLMLSLKDYYVTNQLVSRIHFRNNQMPVHFVCMSHMYEYDVNPMSVTFLSNFGCAYMLESLLQRSFALQLQNQYGFNSGFCKCLKTLEEQSPQCLERALTDTMYMLVNGEIIDFLQTIVGCFEAHLCQEEDPDAHYIMPANTYMVRRCVKTPTRTLLWPPEIMFENRVLRKFDHDFALKVSFRDDSLFRLTNVSLYSANELLEETVATPLLKGIKIQHRHFRFLAWSNSQLREHCVWMYAKNKNKEDVSMIRKWSGDFSGSASVPKVMARMGQCFTNTKLALNVPFRDDFHVCDVKGGLDLYTGEPYVFSDGVGCISMPLALKVCDSLGLKNVPSAFQIRYKGYKGMLTLNPDLPEDRPLLLRDSMRKFNCQGSDDLEIVKQSQPGAVFLNRPLTMILNQMGVSNKTLLAIQEAQLCRLTDMLLKEDIAARYLAVRCSLPALSYSRLVQSGAGITCDPFFRSILLRLHIHNVAKIRSKGRLEISPSEGRVMLGVMDETNSLKYGQVFVQYSSTLHPDQHHAEKFVRTGRVLVTKSPCMQGGDVRIFQSVNIPALGHIVDCIVFPQNGPRPHPNEMAGSDLDGDEYVVIWKKELLFERENEPASDFPSVSKTETITYPPKDRQIINFLKRYIANDQMGVMGSTHLAQADREEGGIFSDLCIKIARKYSLAVDFAKSGYVERLDDSEKVTMYPDYMEKPAGHSYKSQRALGKMFRVCRDFEEINQDVCRGQIQVDESYCYGSWSKYMNYALNMRNRYDSLVETIFSKYGLEEEAEALTGCLNKTYTYLQDRHEILNVAEIVTASLHSLWKHFRLEFHKGRHLEEGEDDTYSVDYSQENLEKASAWYMVTYLDADAKFLGFPWILSDYLIEIRSRKARKQGATYSEDPVMKKLNELLQNEEVLSSVEPLTEGTLARAQEAFPSELLEVTQALQILLRWAKKERLTKVVLTETEFVEIFLNAVSTKLRFDSTADLILGFLRWCTSLRFMETSLCNEMLGCVIKKPKLLGKKAMHAYHSVAISCGFIELGVQSVSLDGEIEMEPFPIPVALVNSGRSKGFLEEKKSLQKRSGVQQVFVREQPATKSVVVTAVGNFSAIRSLTRILRKIIEYQSFKYEKKKTTMVHEP